MSSKKMTMEDEAIISLFHFVEEITDLPIAELSLCCEHEDGEPIAVWGRRLISKFRHLRDITDEKYEGDKI